MRNANTMFDDYCILLQMLELTNSLLRSLMLELTQLSLLYQILHNIIKYWQ